MSERLPILLSVPHAGLGVPPELADYHQLTPEQIAEDGDVQAAEIYWPLRDEVQAFATNESYDVIVSEAAGVVYASSAVDITERILESLRAKSSAGN